MYLSDLMDPWALNGMIDEGFVRVREHPQDPGLRILNYTEKAQYEREWNDVTKQCRGLIVQATQGGDFHIVARPWPKFFNLGEHFDGGHAGPLTVRRFDGPAVAQDKMDGSLGILYCAPDGDWAIATRGSFESDQAIHATEVWRRFYEDYWAPRPGFTYLFEIVYPDNRIVLDYGTTDDLFLLDILDNATGQSVLLFGERTNHGFPGRTTGQFFTRSLAEASRLADRPNAEGLVVTLEDGLKVKIKQEDYVRLHKLVTGLNERAVWEHLSTGAPLESLLADVPDEFHAWVREVGDALLDRHEGIQGLAHWAYAEIMDDFDKIYGALQDPREGTCRAWFARRAKARGELAPLLFQMLDGRDISPAIWKTLRPRGETKSLLDRTEDNS